MKEHPSAVKQSGRLNKEQIKKQLLDSFVYDDINKEYLSARDTIKDHQEAMKIIKECENIINTNKTKFKNLVEQFGISKSTNKHS